MLHHTFSHIPGIGHKTEIGLWEKGICTWDDCHGNFPPRFPKARAELIREYIRQSHRHFPDNPLFFSELLPPHRHWRIFPHFRDKTAFLDIETTGQHFDDCAITTIAVYDGTDIFHYVQGENLDDFADDIGKYQVLVSYNGKSFDIPFIERYFGLKIEQAQIDLRHVLARLGFKGGLKSCEKQLGLDRGELDGVDGYYAVLLWQEYEQTGDRRFLETLLAYNIDDAVNLEKLMVEAYNRNVMKTPFGEYLQIPWPARPVSTFSGNSEIIEYIRWKYFGYKPSALGF